MSQFEKSCLKKNKFKKFYVWFSLMTNLFIFMIISLSQVHIVVNLSFIHKTRIEFLNQQTNLYLDRSKYWVKTCDVFVLSKHNLLMELIIFNNINIYIKIGIIFNIKNGNRWQGSNRNYFYFIIRCIAGTLKP